jgi:hypothetical protein
LFFFSYLVFTFFRRPVISELYSVHVWEFTTALRRLLSLY